MARVQHASYVEAGRQPHLKAAVWAGLIAGLVFVVLEMGMVAMIAGESPWAPPRMIAAILLGSDVLSPATFDFGILMTALLVHFALSILLGIVLAYLVYHLAFLPALLVGALFGLAIYLFNFYVMTELFPWFAMARNWISVFAHVVFGLVLAWSYKGLARRQVEHKLEA